MALVLLVTLIVGIVVTRPALPVLLAFAPAADCSAPPDFQPTHNPGGTAVSRQGSGFRFDGQAIIEANICLSGTLNITASGKLAGEELPQLSVHLNDEPLATLSFDQQRTVAVQIPRPGRVFLGFLNDFYDADVRVASLVRIKLHALDCQDFSVEVPSESAGTWAPQYKAASLVRDPPMILVPCAAGELSMSVRGREGNNALPILAFKQGGKIIMTIQTKLEWQEVNLSVKAAPLIVSVINPYAKVLADRSLNIERLEFISGQ